MAPCTVLYLLVLLAPLVECQSVSPEPSLEEKIIIAVVLGAIIGTALGFSFCFWYRYFRYGRVGARKERFRDIYTYDKNDDRNRSKYETYDYDGGIGRDGGYGRDRSYDEFDRKRNRKYDERPGKFWGKVVIIRKGDPDEPKYTPHKTSAVDEPDSKALVPYNNRRNYRNGYYRDGYSDNISGRNYERYSDSRVYQRPQVTRERRYISDAPAIERSVIRSADVGAYTNHVERVNTLPAVRELPMSTRYVSSGPTVREIVETPINEPIQKEVVYVQEDRPAQTSRVYESSTQPTYVTTRVVESQADRPAQTSRVYESPAQPTYVTTRVVESQADRPTQTSRVYESATEPNYVTTRVIESRPAATTKTSEVIYSQQPQTNLSRSQVIREVIPVERSSSEPINTTELISKSRRNDPYIVYSPQRGRKERSSNKGYSDYLARSNYLGTRSEDGGINGLYKSGKDYLALNTSTEPLGTVEDNDWGKVSLTPRNITGSYEPNVLR